MKQFFSLLLLRFIVAWRNFIEFLKVLYLYYPKKTFRQIDIYLLRHYILNNPYRIYKRFLSQKKKDVIDDFYGETPLTTLDKIVHEADIKASDCFFELGSGRGRTCFWVHAFCNCQVVGVECVPEFIAISRKVASWFSVKDVTFIYKDFLDIDLSKATLIYFYGTCAAPEVIGKLIEKCRYLRPGTTIITVSYPLSFYATEKIFLPVKSFLCQFPWGEAEVYIEKIANIKIVN